MTEAPRTTVTPAPHLRIEGFLGAEIRDRLVTAATTAVERAGPEPPVPPPPTDDPLDDIRSTGFEADLGDLWEWVRPRLAELAAPARRELGLDHFALTGIAAMLCVHRPDGMFHTAPFGEPDAATRRIEFLYTFSPDPSAFDGGRTRLYDTTDRDGFACATDTFTELAPDEDTLVVFGSDVHHDTSRVGAVDERPAVRFTLAGWLSGEPVTPGRPDVDADVLRELQVRYIPRHAETPFVVMPTPEPVRALLESLRELRWERRHAETADPTYQRGGSPDFIDVGDVSADILAHLQPLHEDFAGVPLTPAQTYGLRIYRRGQSLTMHVDRPATHVVSSVLHVASEVDRPWPLQVDADGRRHEVLLNPGQMLLYEGAACPHGRITPLEGDEYTNLFAHYHPAGWPWDVGALTDRALQDGVIDHTGRLTGR